MTENMLEKMSWETWKYVRNNRDSLNSDVMCRYISCGFEEAARYAQERLGEVIAENKSRRLQCARLKKDIADMKKDVQKLLDTWDGVEKNVQVKKLPVKKKKAPAK